MSLVIDRAKDAPIGMVVHHAYGSSVVLAGGHGRWLWCKHCRRNSRPLSLVETVHGERTRMALCATCRHGLTAPVPA